MKGYGIFVGVNKTKKDHYKSEHNFPGAACNAEAMYNLVKDIAKTHETKTGGYECQYLTPPLLKEKATWSKVRSLLLKYARMSKKSDEPGYLVVYFSGHGFNFRSFDDRVSDVSDILNPPRESIQFLCFHDRMVLENEIRDVLTKFSKKFKIVVIVDSCYADGISTGISSNSLLGKFGNSFSIVSKDNKKITDRELLYEMFTKTDSLVSLGENVNDLLESDNLSFVPTNYSFQEILAERIAEYLPKMRAYPNSNRWRDYKADVLYYSACQDSQTALFGRFKGLSNYTEYFKCIWELKDKKGREFAGNYFQFNEVLKDGLQANHEPIVRSNPYSPNSFFRKTVPLDFLRKYNPKRIVLNDWRVKLTENGGGCDPVTLEINFLSPQYKVVNHLVRSPLRDIDLRLVKKYIRQLMIDAHVFVIVKVSMHENGSRNCSYKVPDIMPCKKKDKNCKTKCGKLVALIYDIDRSRVVAHSPLSSMNYNKK